MLRGVGGVEDEDFFNHARWHHRTKELVPKPSDGGGEVDDDEGCEQLRVDILKLVLQLRVHSNEAQMEARDCHARCIEDAKALGEQACTAGGDVKVRVIHSLRWKMASR